MNLDDTIVAIATPPGRGGIGVVRIAGSEARTVAETMLRLKRKLQPAQVQVCDLIDPDPRGAAAPARETASTAPTQAGAGAFVRPEERSEVPILPEPERNSAHPPRIDEVVVTYFAKPHSYTTDDIVEISAHGSPVVLRRILELALAAGARLADPGEFTMRAFLNGRLDLTQAEAVRDLIDSQTLFQAKVAAQQLDGAISHRLKPIKQDFINLIALLEAGIDFAEDDVSVTPDAVILQHIARVRDPLAQLASTFAYGNLVHHGLTLAIVGRPNVGKSSLFNRLVERERAIVTALPGTTRDPVSETVSIGGIPVQLVDTAGIRHVPDPAEAEAIGIKKSMEALAEADLVLVVLDRTQPHSEEDRRFLLQIAGRPAIVVENKSDLASTSTPPPASTIPPSAQPIPSSIATSALTGHGIADLRAAILRHLLGENTQPEPGFLTGVRHQKLVTGALTSLAAAEHAVRARVPHEMLLLDLYAALRCLDEITGLTTADDILNLIFSTFCIGK